MFGLGSTELILIVLVLVLLFGASRLPQLAKSLGQSRKAFKEGMRDAELEESADRRSIDPAKVNSLSDEELMAEMQRRRAQTRT